MGPSLALKLIGECGTDLRAWPTAKHFTSWLGLAPGKQNLRRQGALRARADRLVGQLRCCGWRPRPLGGAIRRLKHSDRRLSSRAGKAKAVTATARKIAVLFYNTLRHGMTYRDPGADHYEEQYRSRVLANLKRRAKSLGFVLQAVPCDAEVAVSEEPAIRDGHQVLGESAV